MTIQYSDELKKAVHEILMRAGEPYTEAQLKEIPNILNAKHRYFIATDLQDKEAMRDLFTDEAPEGFRTFWNGYAGAATIEAQIAASEDSIGPLENLVPSHYGHNQIVHFVDDTHAKLLTRMHDRHEYNDDGEIYAGWGIYVDDVMKCKDGKWRISTVRLDYCQMQGSLRSQRRKQQAE